MTLETRTSAGRLARLGGELLLLLGCLAATWGVVMLLGFMLLPLGVPRPGRWARKLLVPLFVVIYFTAGRIGFLDFLSQATFRPLPRDWWKKILTGYLAGGGTLLVMVLILVGLGYREFIWTKSPLELLARGVFYFFTSIFVLAVLEEGLFRGLLYRRLETRGGVWAAILLGSLLFALSHFMKPAKGRPIEGLEGIVDVIPGSLSGLAEVGLRYKEVVGLLMVGLVLAILRKITGNIYTGLGVHGGWVSLRHLNHGITDEVHPVDAGALVYTGSNRFYDGLAGWCALFATLLVILLWARVMKARAQDQAGP